jgi:phage shock protein A
MSERRRPGLTRRDALGERERTMADETGRADQLESERAHLLAEVDRYRDAAEEALQQLDWCISYFARNKKGSIAQVLRSNRADIRRHLDRALHAAPGAEGT